MKMCSTCGMQVEDRTSFCPCCGSSLVVPNPDPAPAPTPTPVTAPKKPIAKPTPPLPFFEEEKKKGGHALPITIIAILSILAIGLGALWATGGLAAMLNKDAKTDTLTTSKPTISLNEMPDIAATYGNGQKLTTQQYLAYLYLEFEYLYYMYQYEMCGIDPWAQQFPYGEDGEQLYLSDYIIRATQDNIKQQIVLQQMMEEYGIQWIAEEEAEIDKGLSSMKEDVYIDYGFDNDTYAYVLKNANLNERSAFYSLYKVGGARAVNELDLRRYFASNYLSYHALSIAMTDSNGNELDKDGEAYAQIMAHVSVYLDLCETQGFAAAYEAYEQDQSAIESIKRAAAGGSVIPIYTVYTQIGENDHEHEHRQDVDAFYLDPAMAQAVRTVNVGDATIVEYKAGGTTPTIALIERLDIYSDASVYEDAVESIIYEMRYEAFNQEVEEAMSMLVITFNNDVITKCKPEDFLAILSYN